MKVYGRIFLHSMIFLKEDFDFASFHECLYVFPGFWTVVLKDLNDAILKRDKIILIILASDHEWAAFLYERNLNHFPKGEFNSMWKSRDHRGREGSNVLR